MPGARERTAREASRRGKQRRKAIFVLLLAVAGMTGVWALVNGGDALEINLVADAAVAFYAALLLDAKRRRDERAVKVHSLSRPVTSTDEEYFQVIEAGGGRNR